MGHLQMEYYPIKKKKILPFVTAWMDSWITASGGGEVKGGGIEQKGKRTHGHGQQCGDC